MFYSAQYKSPLGTITLLSTKESLLGLWIEGQKYEGMPAADEILPNENLPVLAMTKKWLDEYFAGKKSSVAKLPLAPVGGKFRQEVWKILLQIPYGKTMTYGQIAQQMAKQTGKKKMSAQAVGGAVGHNQISIIIPCHRIIGANGNLTGYAGGIDKKIKLLQIEGVDTAKMFMPKKSTAL